LRNLNAISDKKLSFNFNLKNYDRVLNEISNAAHNAYSHVFSAKNSIADNDLSNVHTSTKNQLKNCCQSLLI